MCADKIYNAAPLYGARHGKSSRYSKSRSSFFFSQSAFTLIELVIVLLIMGIALTLFGMKTGRFSFWRDETFVRKLSEVMVFLHHQAMVDSKFYQLEFDLEKRMYRVGVLYPVEEELPQVAMMAAHAGNLSLELAARLSPAVGESYTVNPPESFPSLAEPVQFPEGVTINFIRTPRGVTTQDKDGGTEYVLFSPRGFSEFSVIQLTLSNGAPVTILTNPFTGLTEIYREYRDFEWTYGKDKKK